MCVIWIEMEQSDGLYSTDKNESTFFVQVTVIEWKGIKIMYIYFKAFMIIVIHFNWVYFVIFLNFILNTNIHHVYSTYRMFVILGENLHIFGRARLSALTHMLMF